MYIIVYLFCGPMVLVAAIYFKSGLIF